MFARSLLGTVAAGHTLIAAGHVSCSYFVSIVSIRFNSINRKKRITLLCYNCN